MNISKRLVSSAATVLTVVALFGVAGNSPVAAQMPGGGKQGNDPAMRADMELFHYLLDHRKDVKRTIKKLDNGVETITESDDAEVAKKIQEHVEAMHKRVKDGKGIHLRDPLFADIFKNYDKVTMKVEKTEKGVKVTETSTDPYVAKLIQAHAEVVTKFIENGHAEMHRNHPLPEKDPAKK